MIKEDLERDIEEAARSGDYKNLMIKEDLERDIEEAARSGDYKNLMIKEDLERDIEEAASSGDYKNLVLRKQEWMSVHLREISYFLEPLLPSVVNSENLFSVENLKACPESDSCSDRLHIFSRIDPDTGEPAIKFVEDSRGACVPLTRIRTSAVRSIYEKMMEFISKSDLPVYNPESHTGFWSSLSIRVNSVGKSMLVIEVYWLDPQEKSLKPELLNNLQEYLQKSEENLLTVVLKLHSLNSVTNLVLYGASQITENVNNLDFTINPSQFCSWNSAGEEGFCENLIYLCKLEKQSWSLIQIGCLSTVSTITLAAACSHSVVFNVDGEVRDLIITDAKKNSVNLQIVAECTVTSLNGALTQRLSHTENICAVIFDVNTQLKDGDLADTLRSCSKVNRILFISHFKDPALLRRLVLCCSDHDGDTESFIVTRAVPVNLSHFNSNQIIIFVLERRSLVGNTQQISMYNKDRVTEFLWGRKCKYIDAPYKDDDRYFALIPEKTLLQSIFEMIQNGRPKSALEYEEQLKLKQECIWLQGQAVTALLWGVLPKIMKNQMPGFCFPLKALKAPKFDNTLSFTLGAKPVKSENEPKKWTMKYGLIDDNDEITVPLKEIHSPWAKLMYEKTMKFIEDYGYQLYNIEEKSGFWKYFKIKLNPEGLMMVVIGVEVDPEPQEAAEVMISKLESALKGAFKDDNLRSLILKVYLGGTIQYKIVAGIEFLQEEISPFKMFNYHGNMPWMNSNGALEIARVVVDLIAVDSTWSVVQFGRTHDAMFLYIAKCCQVLHVVHDDKETKRCLTSNCQLNLTNQLIMYHENPKGKDFMDIIQYNSSNVCCVIPDFSYYKKNVDVNFLKNTPNVKKIICISKLTDPIFINEIVSLCDGVQSENEAFIIKEVVPVDTSPHDNVIKTVTLLVRQSLVKDEVESNPVFDNEKLQEFYSKSDSEKHTFLGEVCNLVKPCIATNSTRFKFFQSLNLYSVHGHSTSVARRKSQMTADEQIRELQEGSTSEIEEADDPNHEYRDNVAKEIEKTMKKQDFETLWLLKQKWMSLHLKIICNFLKPLIPVLLKNTNPSNFFHIGNFQPCLAANSSSDRLHVFSRVNSVTGEPELKFVADSHGKFFQLTHLMIRNETIKYMYEKMVNLINTSNLTLFNPETCIGTLHSLLIRVNDEGQSFVEIKIFLPLADIKHVIVSSLKILLQNLFEEENLLLSIMLRIKYTETEETETLFGMVVFFESGSNLQLTGSDIAIDWHPAGIEELRKTLIGLSRVQKQKCAFVQIGCLSPVITIGLATLSMYSVVLNVDAYTRELLVVAANQNMILLEATQENSAEAFRRSLTKKLLDCERVCLVVFNSKLGMKDEQFADILIQHSIVDRILFVSLFDDLSHMRKIVACCCKQDEEDKAFLIKKIVPVDMAPCEHSELVICVLERRHAMLSNIVPNVKYNAEKTTAYLQNILPEESSALVSEQVLVKNRIPVLQKGGPTSVKQYKKQMLIEGSTSEIEEADDDNQEYRDSVAEEIEKTMKKQDFETLVLLKQKWMSLHLKIICNFLEPLIPMLLINTNPSNLFHTGDLKPCLATNVNCDRLHVFSRVNSVTGEPELKFVADSHGKFFQLTQSMIHNETIKHMYEKVVNLMNTSNLTLFNPETCTGTLHSLLIRVNSEGQSFIEIKIVLPLPVIKHVFVSSLTILLQDFFNEENLLLSIMLRIQYTDSEETETLFGMAVFFESGSNLQLTGSDIAIDWHPAGIEELRKTLISLSKVKKQTCAFVQIGCLSPVITIGLATLSMYSVVLNVDAYTCEHLVVTANQNMILLEATQENSAEALARSLIKKLPDCERVCLVVFNSKLGMKDEQFADLLIHHSIVERILFVSLFDDLSHLRKIVACCCKRNEEDKIFLITQIVPVDMAPYENSELVICVLERRHAMLANIIPNSKFSAEKTTAYLQNILAEGNSTLVSEQVLLKNIITMLQMGGPTSVKQYKKQIKWKHDLLWLYGKAFCCLLRELIPCVTKTRIQTPGFLFPMKPLKPCVFKETVCSLLYVDCTVCKDGETTPFSVRFGLNDDQNGGFTVPLNEIHSPGISCIFELMVRFIEQSGYELYNPATDTGVWINFKIRLNSKAKALLHISVKPRLELIELLKEYFNPHEDLFESLVLKFLENESGLEKEVIIMGKEYITEDIDGYELNLCEPMSWFDPNGFLQLSKTVIHLSRIDRTWTGIQFGNKYDLGYSIAKNCYKLHVLCKTEKMKKFIWNNAKQVGITNIRSHAMFSSLFEYTKKSHKICLFIPDTTLLQTKSDVDAVVNKPNIEKIVCISKFTDPLLVNLVVRLVGKSRNGFLLKEAIPVDMSPHDNCVNVVFLLVRKSSEASNAEENKDFSVTELRKYYVILASQKQTLITSIIDNLTRSFAEFQDEKRQFDRCLSFDWTTYESDKQTLIKEVEEAGNPSVMEVVRDELNDDVKGDPGCDQEDDSDKQTLIKEIEVSDPSVVEVVGDEVTDFKGDPGFNEEDNISTNQVNENNPSSELQLLSLIADRGLVLSDNIAKEVEEVLSSQGMKMPNLDKTLVPVKALNEDIISMIHAGGPKTIDEYHKQLRWKHECTWLQAKAFCSIIACAIPYAVKVRTQGLLFNMNGIKACPFMKTVSEVLCVKSEVSRNDPDELVMRHRLSTENDTVLSVKSIYSEKVAELYIKMMVVIKSSGYPLHHPKKNTGYWKHFTIRVNSVGDSMLTVTIVSPSQNVGTQTIVSHIKILLLMNFKKSDVDSLVLEVISGFEYNQIVLLGELHLPEIVGNVEVKLCPHALWSNPYGILEVCRAIVNMASLDDTWAVIQLGQGYDVVHFYVAKHCGILHMQCLSIYRNHVVDNAKANLIKNITYSENLTDILKSIELSSYSNICVIIPELIDFDEDAVCLIKDEPKIKKIICVSEFTDPLFIDRIVSSCYDEQNSEKSFVIKDVTPVDMSPWDNLVKIVALLTRKNRVKVDHNQEFSNEQSKELLAMTDTVKQHRLSQISDLIEPFVATHDEKSLYDRTLKFRRENECYNEHKDNSGYSDKNILKYTVSKYVTSNKFYSEIEKILISDKPKTHDLYKNILSHKEVAATSLVDSLRGMIKPFQAFFFTGEKEIVENLKTCPVVPTLSERIYVPLANKSLNPQTSARSLVYNDLYRRCQTDPGRRTYNLLMQFIRKSEYRIYNPSKGSGLWDSFLIRTDSTGNVYIVVVVQHLRKDNKKVDPPTLVSMLKQHLVDTRCPDYNVVSINVRVMERGSLKLESEFGPQMATEVIDDFHLKFNFKNILTYNRYGIKNLCTAVVELAELDKKWQVLQVGTECGIDVFHLAKKCNWVHYVERDKKFGIDIMVEKNTAKNITVWTLQNKKMKLQKILENLKDQENICVVEYFTRDFEAPLNKESDEFLPPAALRKCTNVKKIIYVSELSDSSWESKLKICCLLKEDWEHPFVIKKFLTIDMSPFDNHIMLVCLLTRDIEFGVKSNPDYSPFKVRNELIKNGYLVVRMKHKNIISSALPLSPQRRNKGYNIHNTQKSEIDRKKRRSPCISRETTEIPHVPRLKRSKSPVKDESHDRKVPRLNSPERTATKYPHILGSVGSGAKQDQQHLIKPLKFRLEETLKSVRARQCKRTSIDTSIKNTTISSDLNQNNPSNSGQSQQMPPTANFIIPSTISNSGQYQLIPPTTTTKIATTISSSMQKPSEGNIVNFTESGTGINKEYVSLKTFPLRETVVSMSQYHKPEILPVDGNMLRSSGFDVMPVENNPTKSNTFEEFLAKEILHRSTHGSKKTLPVEETTIEEFQCETHKGVSVARNTVRKSRFDVHFKGSTAKRDIFEEVPIKKTMEKDAAHNVVKRYSLNEASLKSSAHDDTERLPVEENMGNKSTYYEHFKESSKKSYTFEEVPSKNTMEKEVAHNVVKRDPLKEASLKSSSRDDIERLRKEKNVKKSRYDEYFKASTAKSDTFEEMPIRKTMEKEAFHNVKSYPLKEASSKSSTHDYTERLPKEQNVKSYLLKEASLKSSSHDDTKRLRKEKNVKKSRYDEYFKASTAKSDTFEEMPIRKTMEKEAVHNVKSYPLKEASSKSSTHDYTERLPKEQNVKSYLLKEASLKSSSHDDTERLRKEKNVKKSRYDEYFKASTAKSDTFEEMPIRKTMEKEAVHNVKSYPLKEASSKSSTHDYTERLPKEQNVKSYLLKEASLERSVRDDTERLPKERNMKKYRYDEYFKVSTAKSDTFELMPNKKTIEKEAFHSAVKRCPLKESSLKSSAHDEIEGNVVNKSRFDVHCMESTAESNTFEEVAIQNTMEKEVAHNVVKRNALKEASLKDSVHDDDTERLRVENSLLKSLLGLLFEKDAAENDTLEEEAPVTKSVEYSQRILTEYLDEESGVQNSEYYVPQELTLGKNNLQSSGVDRLFEANNKISDTLMEFLKNKSVAQSSRLDVLPVSNDAKYRLDDTSVKTLSQNSSDDMFQRGLLNENMAPIAKEHVLKRGVVGKIAQSYEYGLPARDFIEQSKRPSNFEYATTSSFERDLLHVGEERNRMKLVHKFGITEGVPEQVPEKLTLWRPRTSQDYTTNISPSNTVDDLFCRRNDLRSQHDTVSQEIIDIKPCDRLGSTAGETDVYPKRSTLDKEDLSAACARLQNFFRK